MSLPAILGLAFFAFLLLTGALVFKFCIVKTLADYVISVILPQFYDKNGTIMVIVNTTGVRTTGRQAQNKDRNAPLYIHPTFRTPPKVELGAQAPDRDRSDPTIFAAEEPAYLPTLENGCDVNLYVTSLWKFQQILNTERFGFLERLKVTRVSV
jgi:hypothetical protein